MDSPLKEAADSRPVLAIVGNGMSGQRLCERIVELHRRAAFRIVVFGEESRPAYDRVRLSQALRGFAPETLELRSEDWYRAHGIELHLKDAVESIDRQRRVVLSSRGGCLEYDHLVFATGSASLFPSVPGMDAAGVFGYRTIEEAEAIRAAALRCAARAGRAGVLGGGLLGIEAARLLQSLGCSVLVVERAAHLLPRQLPLVASRRLEQRLRELGLDLRLPAALRRIEEQDGRLRLELGTHEAALVDFLVVAVGVRPRDELARLAGVRCDPAGGIVVDDRLRSSDPSIFAIGECARHRGVLSGLAAPGFAMADVLADQLCGLSRSFAGSAAVTHLKIDEIEVAAVGNTLATGADIDFLTQESSAGIRGLLTERARAIGALRVGPWEEWPRVQDAVIRRARIGRRQREHFERSGSLWGAGQRPRVSSWPDTAIVCACTGTTCGTLRACIAAGARTESDLAARTRASSVCGSCRALLAELLGRERSAAPPHWDRGLAACTALAAAVVLALLLLPGIAAPRSVQKLSRLAFLWTDGTARQCTGFGALALGAASLGLSLRKRWSRMRRGSFAGWRIAHAGLGVACAAGVALHTGLHLGNQLDFALLASFLALAALGSAAGAVTALEPLVARANGAALRRTTAQIHAWVFWPFLVLVGFHVLKIYWF